MLMPSGLPAAWRSAASARRSSPTDVSGLVARNAARLTRPPRLPRGEMRILTREQIPAFLEAARPERLAALFHVAIASGAREGELLALRWSHVDWTRGAIRIARTLQRTSAGLSFAECKTRSSERTVAVGPQRWRRSARTASARPRSVSVSDSAKGPRTASCSRARLARRSTLATSYAARSAGRSNGPRFPTCRSIRLDTRTRRWRSRRGVHGRTVADRL